MAVKDMLKMQKSALQSNDEVIKEKLNQIKREESENEDENFDAEKDYLKKILKEEEKKKEEIEIELSIQEQEEHLHEEIQKEQEIEISKKMLKEEEEKEEEEQEQSNTVVLEESITPVLEEEIDPRLLKLQQQLQERGILSRIEGSGSAQYLKTDQEGLQQIDPNTTTIEQIDKTLEQQQQESAIQKAIDETEEYKKRIMDQYVNPDRGSMQDLPPYSSGS